MKQPLMFVVVFVALILASFVPDRDPYLLRFLVFVALSLVFMGLVAFFTDEDRAIGRKQRRGIRKFNKEGRKRK